MIITGNKGFIGSYLHKRLTEAIGIDLKDGLNILTCNLPETDIVYHLASQTSVPASFSDPVNDSLNFNMVVRLVKEYPNSRIIFASSIASIKAESPYGFSKWICNEYIKRFHKNYVICYFPYIYGKGSKNSVVEKFKGKEEVVVFNDGQAEKDYVWVEDLVDGLVMAQDWPTGEYFMTSGIGTRTIDLAKGKKISFIKQRDIVNPVVPNNCPNWKPIKKVIDYIYE